MRHYPFTSSPPSSFTIIIISSFTHCFNHYNNTLSYASPPLPFTISFTIVIAIYIPHHISIPPPHCRPPSLSLSFVNRRDSEQPRGEQQPRRRRRRRRRRRHGRRGGQRRHAPGHLSGKKRGVASPSLFSSSSLSSSRSPATAAPQSLQARSRRPRTSSLLRTTGFRRLLSPFGGGRRVSHSAPLSAYLLKSFDIHSLDVFKGPQRLLGVLFA